jgi:hypothetical protein
VPSNLDIAFKEMQARGGFLVSAELKDGVVSGVKFHSEKGRSCSVQNPWPGQKVQLVRNGTVEEVEMRSGDRFTFKTVANETVELQLR